MTRLILIAVLRYLAGNGERLTCEAAVVCEPGAQSCQAHPIQQCPGSRNKEGELKGKWNLGQCLTAELLLGAQRAPVLGCSPDRFTADVDVDAVRKAGGK